MGAKIGMARQVFIPLFVATGLGSILYKYWYPWLYNKVNDTTQRGQNLDDNIDLVNLFIMLLISGLLVGGVLAVATGLITGLFLKRIKRKSK